MNDKVEEIRIYGDKVLRLKAEEVQSFDGELKDLAEHLIETLYNDESGIGLAAPQIGVSRRVFAVDRSFGKEFDNMLVMVNPKVTLLGEEISIEEGCLSVPGIYEQVSRPEGVSVQYWDIDGNKHELEADDYLARVIQHENDHLDGVLFVDRLSSVKRHLLGRKLRELSKKGSTV